MDKKASRDKRMKNLTFKSKKGKEKEPERKAEKDNGQEKESTNLSENTLPNNWSKYEITDDDTEPGADFETLLQEPISNESHFKFKSEQNWDADIKSQLELNKYFTLDLKLLAEGISTIPFPKRHNFNTNLFTDVELDSIKRHSENNSQKYKKFLEKKFPTKNNIIIKKNIDEKPNIKIETNETKTKTETNETKTKDDKTNTDEIIELDKEINNVESQKINIVEIKETNIVEIKVEPKGQRMRSSRKQEDDVDELLNLKSPQKIEEPEIKDEDPLLQPTEIKKPPMPQQSADLEQWLDDILDD